MNKFKGEFTTAKLQISCDLIMKYKKFIETDKVYYVNPIINKKLFLEMYFAPK